ncbi:MAG: hypothetical protein CMN84_10005 [Spongiibacteraceae bacterium]|nr:hypothetical protein [Spongiibacteraceae bacterium]
MESNDWGLLPDRVLGQLRQREWDNRSRLSQRMTGDRPLPIRVGLKPPSGKQGLAQMARLREFIEAWRHFPHSTCVTWEQRSYRDLGEVTVPKTLEIPSIDSLIDCLGPEAREESRHWEKIMKPIVAENRELYPVLSKHLNTFDRMSEGDAHIMAALLPQLSHGMGHGYYLRGIPIEGVDTKFIETYQSLIEAILNFLYDNRVIALGGLLGWLGCKSRPRNWLTLRTLCPTLTELMGGHELLQLPAEQVMSGVLPVDRLLVVENLDSALSLPHLPGTLAVTATGKNVAWMKADWLQSTPVGYWGDIDTWGLDILSLAREHCPALTSLMMDQTTFDRYKHLAVREPTPKELTPYHLTKEEQALFVGLRDAEGTNWRLEHERLPQDYVAEQLWLWAGV